MSPLRRVAVPLLSIAIGLVACRLAQAEAGDSFIDAEILASGVTAVSDELLFFSDDLSFDLFLGVFDAPFQAGDTPFNTDDDSSQVGDGFAPQLLGVPINPGGGVDFAITGFSDPNFIGEHSETGVYRVELTIFNSQGASIDGFLFDGFLETTFIDSYSEFDAAWNGGTYDVVVNNAFPNDVDFFRFTGLTAGERLFAETSGGSLLDTLLGWFDELGNLIDSDNNGGDQNYSRLPVVVPASGEVVLGVTGGFDMNFDGSHTDTGAYNLTLSLAGDYDGDGDVDTDDYAAWQAAFGQMGSSLLADGNGDGTVNAADYTVWRDSFGSSSSSAAVPEPAGLLLVMIALTVSCRVRRVGRPAPLFVTAIRAKR